MGGPSDAPFLTSFDKIQIYEEHLFPLFRANTRDPEHKRNRHWSSSLHKLGVANTLQFGGEKTPASLFVALPRLSRRELAHVSKKLVLKLASLVRICHMVYDFQAGGFSPLINPAAINKSTKQWDSPLGDTHSLQGTTGCPKKRKSLSSPRCCVPYASSEILHSKKLGGGGGANFVVLGSTLRGAK